MVAIHPFDATSWLVENTHGGIELSPDAREAVASFTTMWNFFESTLCENRASVAALTRISERFEADRIPPGTNQALEDCLAFWQFRYRTPDGFGRRFDGLYFRPNDKRAQVEAVLNGESDNPREKLLALMIIVFRLRNNLFHGLKSLEMLNDQVENLATASRCLAAVMESVPSRFVWAQHQRPAGRRRA
jgi:hypothetical protein